MEKPPIERLIMIVEDNPDHADSIANVLKESSTNYQIVTIADGTQAIDYLYHRGEYADALRPDLILLDLNLPGKNGKEILAEIKADRQLHRIPIVVLTFSQSDEDIFGIYALQGNCYVMKSNDLHHLTQIVKRIEEFWLRIVTLPLE
ncbi:response regulator [[Phormidium ambiguum] IAM M-71]|uniref:Response regulator n=1 Tax=[Phormidium ambiguum] IAM M-71 TaxID=454136 RepID=A0A1U7I4D8_9CYAN|nr:response regulator [Phormidium ambiguum]OKH31051.1 response regulator [Phormidium ambiguum IAM M-71]